MRCNKTTLSVWGLKDEENDRFINAVFGLGVYKNGFTIDYKKIYENPFIDGSADEFLSGTSKDEFGRDTIIGTTFWHLETEYIIALSKLLDLPVGSTSRIIGFEKFYSELAIGENVTSTEIDKHQIAKEVNFKFLTAEEKWNNQGWEDSDNYNKYIDALDIALDKALVSDENQKRLGEFFDDSRPSRIIPKD